MAKIRNKSELSNSTYNFKSADGLTLDTLGIVTPPPKNKGFEKPKSTRLAYINRQKAKAITMAQLYPLIDLNSNLKKSYWNTYHCNHYIEQRGLELKSTYCDARWCTVCNRVRMAKMINAYSKPLLSLNELHFVTLTAPNVKIDTIRSEIDRMLSRWVKIRKYIGKYRKDIKLKGIRKLECTFNFKTGFNPHFHIIISGKEAAEAIKNKWLELTPGASNNAQDIREANDGSLIELFKYTAKGVTKGKFYAKEVDAIYHGLYYRKTYYPIGIKKYIEESIDGIEVQEVDFLNEDQRKFEWNNDCKEWFDEEGTSLTDHALDGELFDWIENLTANDK